MEKAIRGGPGERAAWRPRQGFCRAGLRRSGRTKPEEPPSSTTTIATMDLAAGSPWHPRMAPTLREGVVLSSPCMEQKGRQGCKLSLTSLAAEGEKARTPGVEGKGIPLECQEEGLLSYF